MRLGSIFDVYDALDGDELGIIPPRSEHLLSFEAKVQNRIRVNDFILRALR